MEGKMKESDFIFDSVPYKGPTSGYDEAGRPLHWMSKAQQLHRAAGVLFETIEKDFVKLGQLSSLLTDDPNAQLPPHEPYLLQIFVFLSALSVENLLKGILVRGKPELVSKGKLRGNMITKHSLPLLARESGVTLSKEQQEFLEVGTAAIEYWGRYPVPRNVSKLESSHIISSKIASVYFDLYKKLSADLQKSPT